MESVCTMVKQWTISRTSKLFESLCPNLFSHALNSLSNVLNGHISSYFSNNRCYNKLLFDNFSNEDNANGLLCQYNEVQNKRLYTGSCHVSNDQMHLTFKDGRSVKCKAPGVDGKASLRVFSNGDANHPAADITKIVTNSFSIPVSIRYLFATKSSVSNLVNAAALDYRTGPMVIRKLSNNQFKIHISVDLVTNHIQRKPPNTNV